MLKIELAISTCFDGGSCDVRKVPARLWNVSFPLCSSLFCVSYCITLDPAVPNASNDCDVDDVICWGGGDMLMGRLCVAVGVGKV